ncbi:MAG: glycosyltransferase family 2 protein [Bacteroidetes bacterium]|nr:glycosyltransferase family 2 protein [Bacteroidota bacterium]
MKVAAIVVTYNRLPLLQQNLNALLQQTRRPDAIIVVDNHSTDGTDHWIRTSQLFSLDLFHYLRRNENGGSSGGFHDGIKYAYECGFDWMWGMDDDAIPATDALERILSHTKTFPTSCFASNCDNDDDGFVGDLKSVEHWMFVGFMVNKHVVAKIGFPRQDFFIYNDDLEYARRIIKAGVTIYKVKSSIIHHKDYSQQQVKKGNFLGKQFSYPIISDWRVYYLTRNRLLSFSYTEIEKYRAFVGVWRTIGIPLLATNPSQFKYFLKGYIHGIAGITGKTMSPNYKQ